MTACDSDVRLDFYQKRPLTVKFSDLDLSSDVGILLARQAEEQLQSCQELTACIEDWRDPNKITHPLGQLVSQRVDQMVGGYEDANDSDFLRHDPIFKIVCGRLPVPGEELLASQPTMSRLENHVTRQEESAMRRCFIDRFIASYESAPSHVLLDIDGWDDPTYGEQEQSAFHGYYGQHMYFPVLINEAASGFPLVLQLRAGNSHPGKGVAGILRWLFWRLKRAWPNVSITLRADGGFSLPEVLKVCERSAVLYAIGFSANAVLNRKIANLLEQARVLCCLSGEKARLFDDVYYAAGTWEQPRRMVMKAEWLLKGPNPRFVVTNMELSPQELYDSFYVQRGANSEHPIKELKLGIQADRLSCNSFVANQFRLLLAQAAYLLMLTLRRAAEGTRLATAQVERLRSSLIKGAARVRVSSRRVLVELAAFCPFAQEIQVIAQRLCAPFPLKLS
jgi:hypothetical protein